MAPEDFHQYSVDEFFMVYEETGIDCAIGVGDNMLLSKLSLDIEAKRMPDGIAEWRYHDVPRKLWPIKPLRNFWGIRSEVKLNERGIFSIGDLARYPVVHLKRDFGVIGVDWHLHANGIDFSLIREKHAIHSPSIAKSQILMRDYQISSPLS